MIFYNGSNSRIIKAVSIVNDIEFQALLCKKILEKEYFDMSTASPEYIANELMASFKCLQIEVKVKKGWWWSKWLAAFYTNKPFDIYQNSRKLRRSPASIVGSIVHEMIHLIDHHDRIYSYGHGDNSPKGKGNTAPYWIGRKAKELAELNSPLI